MSNHVKYGLILAVVLCWSSVACAQPAKTILLKDGSRLNGQVMSLQDGFYTIQTSNLGEIRIHEEDVLSISSENFSQRPAAPGRENASGFRSQVQDIQGSVMSDPALMSDISTLARDPEFIEMLNDKELISDIYSYDPARIQNNPKLQQLMQNPQMRELIEKIQSRQQR